MSVKKQAVKKAVKKTVKKAATKKSYASKPTHPLKINLHAWDRDKVMKVVCDRIATCSLSLSTILAQGYKGMDLPAPSQIYEWLRVSEELQEMYARAKRDQSDYLAEEMLDIADDARNDYMLMISADGQEKKALDKEFVQRSRLRIETRKWLMGKLHPRRYGDTVFNKHSIDEDDPLAILARGLQGASLPIKE